MQTTPVPGDQPAATASACSASRKRFSLDQELRRALSELTIFLLLADLRSGLGDAAFYEISLNLELLLRV